MADSNIGALPPIETLLDDALMVAEQQGVAGRVTGLQFKQFARIGVSEYVEAAQSAAENALEASQQALDAVKMVEGAANEAAAAQAASLAAQAAQTAAEAAQFAAEAARDQAQAIAGGNFLSLAGGTLTGPLVLAGEPTKDNEAATKKYVDDNNAKGDMQSSDYDPTGEVLEAGGIVDYVAANGGKEEIFLTTITYDSTSKTYSADHTYTEIEAARSSEKVCICEYDNAIMPLRGKYTLTSGDYFRFSSGPDSTGYMKSAVITASNEVSVSSTAYVDTSRVNAANGVAGLTANGRINNNQIFSSGPYTASLGVGTASDETLVDGSCEYYTIGNFVIVRVSNCRVSMTKASDFCYFTVTGVPDNLLAMSDVILTSGSLYETGTTGGFSKIYRTHFSSTGANQISFYAYDNSGASIPSGYDVIINLTLYYLSASN